jgi:hypothetical protein
MNEWPEEPQVHDRDVGMEFPVRASIATDMTPAPQPTAPSSTQEVVHDEPDFKLYRELNIVEL